MLRVVLVIALLACHHGGAPQPAIANIASNTAQPLRKLSPEVFLKARALLERACELQEVGLYLQAYADAQRGINVLDGDPDLDNGALLEASTTPTEQDELVIMTEFRTRELERRISGR